MVFLAERRAAGCAARVRHPGSPICSPSRLVAVSSAALARSPERQVASVSRGGRGEASREFS